MKNNCKIKFRTLHNFLGRTSLRTLFRTTLCLFTTIFFTVPSSAVEFLLEPYAGYEMGDVEQGTQSNDMAGENLGFRLGGKISQTFFGFEYALSTLDVDKTGADDELKTKDIGLFVGYELNPVRLWFTLWMDNEADSDNANGTYTGESGYKMGLGFNVFSPIRFNIEKTLRIYKEFESSKLNQKVEVDGFLFSVSIPFSR